LQSRKSSPAFHCVKEGEPKFEEKEREKDRGLQVHRRNHEKKIRAHPGEKGNLRDLRRLRSDTLSPHSNAEKKGRGT